MKELQKLFDAYDLRTLPKRKMISLKVTESEKPKCSEVCCINGKLDLNEKTFSDFLKGSKCCQEFEAWVEKQIKERVLLAIAERDDMWIMHEKEQIKFLKEANFKLLCGLHNEIERLHHELRDTNMKLYVDESPTTTEDLLSENEKLRQRLRESERSNQELAVKLEESAKNAYLAEQQLIRALEIFKNQLAYQGSKIRELTDALRERTENISELVTQARAGSYCLTDNSYSRDDRIISKPSVHLMRVSSIPGTQVHSERPLKPGLVRSISVTYPGGRPNVVVQKYHYNPNSPQSRHLPSLYSACQGALVNSGGVSVDKSTSSSNSSKNEQSFLSQSIRESE